MKPQAHAERVVLCNHHSHGGFLTLDCQTHGYDHCRRVMFRVVGTDYGYLHTTSGDMRLWKNYQSANRAAVKYRERNLPTTSTNNT